jgi:hypothetical protein
MQMVSATPITPILRKVFSLGSRAIARSHRNALAPFPEGELRADLGPNDLHPPW